MQCDFIKTCTALSVVGIAGTAFAGGGERFVVGWSSVTSAPHLALVRALVGTRRHAPQRGDENR